METYTEAVMRAKSIHHIAQILLPSMIPSLTVENKMFSSLQYILQTTWTLMNISPMDQSFALVATLFIIDYLPLEDAVLFSPCMVYVDVHAISTFSFIILSTV